MKTNEPQYVIFKADDIREHPEDTLSPGWTRFCDLIAEADITAALGLIGDSLVDPSDAYVDRLKGLASEARFSFWNHGFDHHLKQTRDDGSVYSEFHNTSLEHQSNHLAETQRLTSEHLGLTLDTFGAPGNHSDDNTPVALEAIPELSIWLYGDTRSKKHILERTINVEHPTHYPDFDAFSESYQADIPVLTLQLHPSGWDDDRFNNFTSIVSFLKERDCVFTDPTEVVAKTAR
jgi:hypothetical protein